MVVKWVAALGEDCGIRFCISSLSCLTKAYSSSVKRIVAIDFLLGDGLSRTDALQRVYYCITWGVKRSLCVRSFLLSSEKNVCVILDESTLLLVEQMVVWASRRFNFSMT